MMLARQGLGMIPSFQFSTDPRVNPGINPFVKFPEGWTQSTVQPVGRAMAPPASLEGLASIFDSWAWQNRKWLVLGGAGLLGLALLAGAGAVLR